MLNLSNIARGKYLQTKRQEKKNCAYKAAAAAAAASSALKNEKGKRLIYLIFWFYVNYMCATERQP